LSRTPSLEIGKSYSCIPLPYLQIAKKFFLVEFLIPLIEKILSSQSYFSEEKKEEEKKEEEKKEEEKKEEEKKEEEKKEEEKN
jgi:uncharacterized membrane protein